jgi:hypothetical protein
MDGDEWIGKLTLRTTINAQYLHAGGHIGYEIRPSKRRYGYGTALLRLGVEAQMLDIMRLLALPPEWRAEVIRQAEAMLHPHRADQDQRTQLDARKKRLVRLYTDGLMTETEYAVEVRALQELMSTLESPFVEDLDLRTAANFLADMPALLAASPIPEQRGILRGVFDRVWVAAHTISAIMPTACIYRSRPQRRRCASLVGRVGFHVTQRTFLNQFV